MPFSRWYDRFRSMETDRRVNLFVLRRRASRSLLACVAVIMVLGFVGRPSAQPAAPITFEKFLQKRFSSNSADWDFERFCPVSTSLVARRVLEAYGSIFAATESVVLPSVCVFRGEAETLKYQKTLQTARVEVGGVTVELQPPAAEALGRAVAEAGNQALRITPYDGAIAGSRTYGQTLMLWNSRFFPALEFWTEQGRLSEAERDEIGGLDLDKKLERILEWEAKGIYFSTNRTRSILTSTAPPGSSQHLTFLAFDVAEYSNPDIRRMLNQNGWFQTVIDDPLHFTFLGVQESDLPGRGLRAVYKGSYMYWVPNISTPNTPHSTN